MSDGSMDWNWVVVSSGKMQILYIPQENGMYQAFDGCFSVVAPDDDDDDDDR